MPLQQRPWTLLGGINNTEAEEKMSNRLTGEARLYHALVHTLGVRNPCVFKCVKFPHFDTGQRGWHYVALGGARAVYLADTIAQSLEVIHEQARAQRAARETVAAVASKL